MNRIKYPIITSLLISLLVMACQTDHFIKDQTYRESVNAKFSERKALGEHRSDDLFGVFNKDLSLQEEEALKFLFAYMPLNDMADYSGGFFYDQMKVSFK
ncbi:MAG: transglutaminase domain-containing protein, partial [Bacteroidales bacterium]|nr:transglutaminase domain-containing protein [Bacteroidales bacterium]